MFKPLAICLACVQMVAAQPLTLVENGQPRAYILVRSDGGEWEKRAAQDLAGTVAKMTGAALPVVHQKQAGYPIVVGQLAVPRMAGDLQSVAKKNPVLRADAIALECSQDGRRRSWRDYTFIARVSSTRAGSTSTAGWWATAPRKPCGGSMTTASPGMRRWKICTPESIRWCCAARCHCIWQACSDRRFSISHRRV